MNARSPRFIDRKCFSASAFETPSHTAFLSRSRSANAYVLGSVFSSQWFGIIVFGLIDSVRKVRSFQASFHGSARLSRGCDQKRWSEASSTLTLILTPKGRGNGRMARL